MRRKLLGFLFIAVFALAFSSSADNAPRKTVRVLTVGNSFAENALTYLPQLTESAGHRLIVGKANLGGCTLERHWRHVAAFESDPNSEEGSPYGGGKRSLDALLKKETWDFVTIQQVSYRSHDRSTYEPYARDLHRYIKERAPDAKIMAHQIWSYRVDDPRFVPKNKGKEPHTQEEMFQQVRQTYHALAAELKLDGIIPSGDAMFAADTDPKWGYQPDTEFDFKNANHPALPRQDHSLHTGWFWKKNDDQTRTLRIDGHHASKAGKYLLGCVWFEALFGESVLENTFVPNDFDPEYAGFLRLTAHNAVQQQTSESTDSTLPRSSPEAQGISSAAIREFIEAANAEIDTMHSFMLVRNGHVVAEAWWKPESAEKQHILWSLSKSFCATAIGMAAEEEKLSLDDPVVKFFPDEAPVELSANLKTMKVRDLLSMSGGHEGQPKFDLEAGPTVKGFFDHPVEREPGTWFQYNTPGSHMLSAILTKATGEKMIDYLKPRLFDPLGIAKPKWDETEEGYTLGGYGLFLRTEDIAKFGQLYLQKGQWQGQQLIAESWVKAATSKQVDNSKAPHAKNPDWAQGYGYQFWRCRHNCYRGDGRDGQICLVIPEHNAIIAITAKTRQMQDQLDLVWEKLLPAFQAKPLPENEVEVVRLKQVVANLVVRMAEE